MPAILLVPKSEGYPTEKVNFFENISAGLKENELKG
jgi:hypothetical protein